MNALERLEDWVHAHKRHSARVEIDNGYGASCWHVTLYGVAAKKPDDWIADEGNDYTQRVGCVFAEEVPFLEPGNPIPPNFCFVDASDDWEGWPGLERTIHAAIDLAEKLSSDK